jgi:hypothetical protein
MTFESRIIAVCERFLSRRTFELVVAPALADLQYEVDTGRGRGAGRWAVLKALAAGLCDDLGRECGTFLALVLMPAAYYTCLIALCFGLSSITSGLLTVAALMLAQSVGMVLVCFWPERHRLPAAE